MNLTNNGDSVSKGQVTKIAPQEINSVCKNRATRQGVKLIFTWGHISLAVAFKGPKVTLGLCKCNYSLTRGKELGAPAG